MGTKGAYFKKCRSRGNFLLGPLVGNRLVVEKKSVGLTVRNKHLTEEKGTEIPAARGGKGLLQVETQTRKYFGGRKERIRKQTRG